jgi:hypothetical protein
VLIESRRRVLMHAGTPPQRPRNETGARLLSWGTNRPVAKKRECTMKPFLSVVAAAALALLAQADTAAAKGCIKGAVVGGVAGHYMGHHGFAGAVAGCVIGRHEANKKAREQRNQTNGVAPSAAPGSR